MIRIPSGYTVRQRARPRGGMNAGCLRIGIGLAMAVLALISFFGSKVYNPVTEEDQYISISKEQEIAIGLQAVPEMESEFGGLDPDGQSQALVDDIGQALVRNSVAAEADYPFEFSLLADDQTVNAFALPGGQVFITRALFNELQTEGQLAGVLAHEIVHVIARHSAERIAEMELTQGLTGAVVIATYDPENPSSQAAAQMAVLIGQLVNMKFGREDEIQSDTFGVRVMADTGYDPRAMIEVMRVLASASDGPQPPEFFSTHPNPENRIARIEAAIQEVIPNGVPSGLKP
jgi:predicted Zn-dependent protease